MGFRGTVRYASIGCHTQQEQCRKDDVEGWLYTLVELTRGLLPWRNTQEAEEVGHLIFLSCILPSPKYSFQVCNFKRRVRRPENYNQLFAGCPVQYAEIMRQVDTLTYYDRPDYTAIYALLRRAMIANRLQEFPYDWEPRNQRNL